ncbi:Protein ABSCISIC ACID-INSENSITIVE 5 [Morus notabilis]|uniref:Protein ABSCISIC ACID-INSENSITIVE 5 n=1 Tax=Morus notabilis TaxID=981085 RepID=W9SEV7_9ROSA|nr:basic leucine zipper 4 [Morus notabilis]EXC25266.1 Protein ABSCISIC ACID-INSENSITIVE 5 [Morus notabilis]
MFFSEEEAVQCSVFESGLTVEELLSLLEPGNSNNSQNSGSDGSSRAVYSVVERKHRRMISNRESARRSRWRKKRHLEDLTDQLNRLKQENRELKNRLGLLTHRCHVACRENDLLSAEFLALSSRLSDLCRILVAMQSQQ